MSTCAMSGRTRKSGVWEFFSINLVDESKVTCICDTKDSRGGKVAKYFNNLIPLSIGRVGKLCGQT